MIADYVVNVDRSRKHVQLNFNGLHTTTGLLEVLERMAYRTLHRIIPLVVASIDQPTGTEKSGPKVLMNSMYSKLLVFASES